MSNEFNCAGGVQNIAQGDKAIGKQENVTQDLRGDGNISSVTGNVMVNGISPQMFAEYAGKLAVIESALASFFRILEKPQVPPGDLDSKLREIAAQIKELEDAADHHSMAGAKANADLVKLQEVRLLCCVTAAAY